MRVKNCKKISKNKMARRGGSGGRREPPKKLPNSEPPNSMVSPEDVGPPGVRGFSKKKKKSADPATRTLNRARFTDHRPPPFLASSNTLHPSRPIFCCIGDQTPPPTSPKSSPPLRFVWCSKARTLLRGTHYRGLHRNHSYPSHACAFDRRCCTSQAGAFAKDGAPNEAQRWRAFGGCGQWRLILDTAEDRTTRVEGIGRGQKRGWSVVCEPRAIQSASGWVSMKKKKNENPRTPGGPTSSGLIVPVNNRTSTSAPHFHLELLFSVINH